MVCKRRINIEDISSKTANKIYIYSKHLIVITKGENPSIFLYNFSSGEQQIVLNGLMPNERNKSSLAFIAYDIVVATLGASGKIEIYLISLDKKVQKLLRVFSPNAKCSTDIASTSDGNYSVTIYAKCKGRPPKIITFRSTNLQNFSRENYYPKAAILGNERIKGLCNFRRGIIFVTADSVFFFNKKNNFFIKSNPLKLGSQDYEVKCLNGGLLGFYTNTFITVFNFDDFYDVRFRNSARYEVRNTQIINGEAAGDNFYVKTGDNLNEIRFFKLFWSNQDLFVKYAPIFGSKSTTVASIGGTEDKTLLNITL